MNVIASTETGKSDIRFRRGLVKHLIEEAYPLGIFSLHHFDNDSQVTLRLVLGNQNYDAIVDDNLAARSPFNYIEITQAHEGENEYLRMLQLNGHGKVSVFGPIKKKGNKRTGIHVEVESVALSQQDLLETQSRLIKKAVDRKAKKTYPENTALLVVFDDYMLTQDNNTLIALTDLIKTLLPDLRNFCWIAFVGWSKNIFLEFNLKKNNLEKKIIGCFEGK